MTVRVHGCDRKRCVRRADNSSLRTGSHDPAAPDFLDQLGGYIGRDAYNTGVRVRPGDGTVAPALQRDLAAANAAVLTQEGHENKTYTLSGGEAASFREIAAALSEIHGATVPYEPTGIEEYVEGFLKLDLPRPVAEFMAAWTEGVNCGAFSKNTRDLERHPQR